MATSRVGMSVLVHKPFLPKGRAGKELVALDNFFNPKPPDTDKAGSKKTESASRVEVTQPQNIPAPPNQISLEVITDRLRQILREQPRATAESNPAVARLSDDEIGEITKRISEHLADGCKEFQENVTTSIQNIERTTQEIKTSQGTTPNGVSVGQPDISSLENTLKGLQETASQNSEKIQEILQNCTHGNETQPEQGAGITRSQLEDILREQENDSKRYEDELENVIMESIPEAVTEEILRNGMDRPVDEIVGIAVDKIFNTFDGRIEALERSVDDVVQKSGGTQDTLNGVEGSFATIGQRMDTDVVTVRNLTRGTLLGIEEVIEKQDIGHNDLRLTIGVNTELVNDMRKPAQTQEQTQ